MLNMLSTLSEMTLILESFLFIILGYSPFTQKLEPPLGFKKACDGTFLISSVTRARSLVCSLRFRVARLGPPSCLWRPVLKDLLELELDKKFGCILRWRGRADRFSEIFCML